MEENHSAVGLVEFEPKQALQGTETACHRKAEEAMTAVQLPEVPAPIGHLHSDGDFCRTVPVYPDLWPVDVYTADQLREYATQAVHQYANEIFAEGWYLACDWASRDDLKFDVDSPAFAADRAARLGSLFTPSEPNSDH